MVQCILEFNMPLPCSRFIMAMDYIKLFKSDGPYLPLQALRIEARPSASSFLLAPCKDIQTRPRPRSFGGSFGQRIGGEGRQGKQLEQLADGGRHGEPAGARIGAGDGGHVAEGEERAI